MSENQPNGYDPFNVKSGGTGSFITPSDTGGCYYKQNGFGGFTLVFPDGTPYKQDAAELRQYILDLEVTRRIEDLANVDFTRNVQPGDLLAYNYTTGNWELTDFISPGEF